MRRKTKWAMLALVALLGFSVALPSLWSTVRVYFLSQQLRNEASPSQVVNLVQEILQHKTDYAWGLVTDYASESSLRAFNRRHGIFLLHDASKGDIHYALAGPEGRFEIPPNLKLSVAEQEALERFAIQTSGRTSTVISFGLVFSGIHVLEETVSDPKCEEVHFILRPKDQPEYHQLVFTFVNERCLECRICGVTDDSLQKWRSSPAWPKDWN